MSNARGEAIYRAVWRWHFYAGLFCVPFIVVLAITGSMYLFKPQVEAWTERGYEFALMWGLLCVAIFFRGGGRYSVDHYIGKEF